MACSLVASIVEFVQIFFAPRTVSINDLIAEHLGSLIGIMLWVSTRQRLGSSLQQLIGGGRRAIQAFLMLYAVAYVVLSLFPYDFIFTSAGTKVEACNRPIWMAGRRRGMSGRAEMFAEVHFRGGGSGATRGAAGNAQTARRQAVRL